jgi:ribokinase
MKSIVVVGSMIYDFVTYADRLPQKGETVLGKTFGMFTGGKGANQAVQSGLLGAETYMIGRVGHDFMGDRIKDALIKSGVHIEYIVTENEKSTGCCCIHVDKHGDNAIIIVPNASTACSDEDVNAAADLFKRGNILLIQLETNYKVVLYSMKKAKEAGMQIILNPAPCQPITDDILKWRIILHQMKPRQNIILVF